ncbi:tape measure protein [Pectobacterium carotovorum]|uniref:tape measure protein n=1 Tax=Pectobacterium carotovorum TaxID=554 RepID=UPI0021F3986D|nr:tape measure protein [Pectobacterium carotovorum]
MAEEVVGQIVYQVDMETGRLLSSQREVNRNLDQMESGFNKSAKSATNLESGMNKLASAIKLVMAAAALRGLADMVQKYEEMSDRVRMATSSQSEFEHVQQRLLKTANGTYRSLSEAQELYITTAASLRSMNYTTDQAIDIQDSMSYAFVKNATSADRANGAISAFSKSMNKGKVEADSWETIIAAIPSVIDDIATASGKTSAQIRALGSSGKITAQQLSEGLRQSLEANSAAAAGMANNLTDAGVRMKTAITAILVEAEKGTGALQSFTNGIISAADALLNFSGDTQNMPKFIDAVTISATALAAVMSSRLVGALVSVTVAQSARTKETISGMVATRAAAVADESAANAAARKAAADKSAAMSALSAAQAELNAMKAATVSTNATIAKAEAELASIKVNLQQIQAEKALEVQRARAQITEQGRIATATRMAQLRQAEVALTQQVARAESVVANARATAITAAEAKVSAARISATNATGAAVVANNALAASQARLAATSISVGNALKVINTALAPLGGTVGVVAIVAAGWYLYAERQAQARQASIEFANTLPDVISKLKEMNLVQAQGVRADTVESITNQEAAIAKLKGEIANLNKDYNDRIALAKQMGNADIESNGHLKIAAELSNQLSKANRDLYEKESSLKKSKDALQQINIRVNQGILDQMKAARDNALAVAELEKKTSLLGGSQAFLAQKLGESTEALKSFNAESLKINWGGEAGEKLIKQAERRLALSKEEGVARARLQAQYDAEDAGITDPKAIAVLQDKYAATESNTEALKKNNAESKKAETQAESIAQKLANLKQESDLAASSTQGMTREQQLLRAEQSLGAAATDEQKKKAREYKAEAIDAAAAIRGLSLVPEQSENQSYQNDLQSLSAALNAKKITQEQYNQQSEQLEANHQANLAKIRADAAVTPTQQSAALIDPVQALANENARKLALIQQFEQQKIITEQQALGLRNAANTQYEQQRIEAQWEIWRNQSTANEALAATFDSVAGNASNALTGIITKSMYAEQALKSIGSNALNSLINTFVQMGVEWVKSAVMGTAATTSGAAAGAAAQTAALGTVAAVQTGALAAQTTASVAAAGTTAAAWTPAAILSSIASMGTAAAIGLGAVAGVIGANLLGKRKNGGPVSAGGLYQVGEGGMPEIYQASNGKQYMIPGDNGSVISNKDMQGGGGVTIIMENHGTPQQVTDYRSERGQNGEEVIRLWCQDFAKGGITRQTVTTYTTAASKANG